MGLKCECMRKLRALALKIYSVLRLAGVSASQGELSAVALNYSVLKVRDEVKNAMQAVGDCLLHCILLVKSA